MKAIRCLLVFILLLLVSICALGAACDDDDDDNGAWSDDDQVGTDDDAADDDAADDDSANGGTDDDADDDSANGGTDDDASDDDASDDDATGLDSIYDVQQGEFNEGDWVTVEGIITSPLDWKGELFFMQDEDGGEYSGIAVYMYSEVADAFDAEMGDVVRVTGEVTEFFGLTELVVKNVGNLEIVGNTDVPDPEQIDMDDVGEPWEGVLIRVDDVAVTEEPNEFGEFEVDDELIVDDLFFEQDHWTTYGITVGDEFSSIAGVLTYNYEEFKLEPRENSDLVE